MAIDATEVVVGANGQVYVAPVGSTAPTDAETAPAAAFVNLGYTSEDGATITDSRETENIGAWQSAYPIRRLVTSRELTVAFALRQWNESTVELAFGGGAVTGSTGDWVYTPPGPEELDERALILDWQDGDKEYRLYIPRGIVTENVETTLNRTSAADLPITFAAMPADDATPIYTLFTNDDAFAPGS